jgi:peptidoglycan/LPS O-acetylase OafA/YrhL
LFVVFVVLRTIGVAIRLVSSWDARPLWYLAYVSNWTPDFGMHDPGLGHMWTLAVEEQFYLVWPFVVFACPRRYLAGLCSAICVAVVPLRFLMSGLGYDLESLIRLTPCRADALVVGAWIASLLTLQSRVGESLGPFRVREAIAPSFASLLCGLIVFAAAVSQGWFSKLLQVKLLVKYGKYSYGIYIIHMIPQMFFYRFIYTRIKPVDASSTVLDIVNAFCVIVLMGIAYVVAAFSWRYLESPFLQIKDRFAYKAVGTSRGGGAVLNQISPAHRSTERDASGPACAPGHRAIEVSETEVLLD